MRCRPLPSAEEEAPVRVAERVVAGAIVLGVVAGIAWFVWWQPPGERASVPVPRIEVPRTESPSISAGKPLFRCDARTQCEQMTSCEEAMFFLQNCPSSKLNLDQDQDGIPCEIQWCQR
jgi:hypothetical protein